MNCLRCEFRNLCHNCNVQYCTLDIVTGRRAQISRSRTTRRTDRLQLCAQSDRPRHRRCRRGRLALNASAIPIVPRAKSSVLDVSLPVNGNALVSVEETAPSVGATVVGGDVVAVDPSVTDETSVVVVVGSVVVVGASVVDVVVVLVPPAVVTVVGTVVDVVDVEVVLELVDVVLDVVDVELVVLVDDVVVELVDVDVELVDVDVEVVVVVVGGVSRW